MNFATAQVIHRLTVEEWDLGESVCVHEWKWRYQATEALRGRDTRNLLSGRSQVGAGEGSDSLAFIGRGASKDRVEEAQA
jgi:hypothetical protein